MLENKGKPEEIITEKKTSLAVWDSDTTESPVHGTATRWPYEFSSSLQCSFFHSFRARAHTLQLCVTFQQHQSQLRVRNN